MATAFIATAFIATAFKTFIGEAFALADFTIARRSARNPKGKCKKKDEAEMTHI
jgi:hypothetical protein